MNQGGEPVVVANGPNANEALRVIARQVPADAIESIRQAAADVIRRALSPDFVAGRSDGLIYGMVQSGKTGVLTVSAAMAIDNGFDGIIVLTSDNDDLYDQTVDRVHQMLRGVNVFGKNDWRDEQRFRRMIRSRFGVVCSKNSRMLRSLTEAFRRARSSRLRMFIVDDEADQASLDNNTRARARRVVDPTPVNDCITELRDYFVTDTYIQVTATPQSLFMQEAGHAYRPTFTVPTEPGADYVGGADFFQVNSPLLDYVDINEVNQLAAGNQPTPRVALPVGLRRSLVTFLVAAGARADQYPDGNWAFLCHISMSTTVHGHIVRLIDEFRDATIATFADRTTAKFVRLSAELRAAHAALVLTEPALPAYEPVEERIDFLLRGSSVKLINAQSNDEIRLDSAFNFLVGGTKLDRGVTIPNLLVSYYGRNPQRPNSDTVLQHARMYGYRRRDLGVTRLFLPRVLADNFRSIHAMDDALRHLIRNLPNGRFEGIFLRRNIGVTRNSVFNPGAIGSYVAGASVNMRLPNRTPAARANLNWIDGELAEFPGDTPAFIRVAHDRILALMRHCEPDATVGTYLWDMKAFRAALIQLEQNLGSDEAYLVIRRSRALAATRTETQGIISGGEERLAPTDRPTLFLYRMDAVGARSACWWPQLRFPTGTYVFSFALG